MTTSVNDKSKLLKGKKYIMIHYKWLLMKR